MTSTIQVTTVENKKNMSSEKTQYLNQWHSCGSPFATFSPFLKIHHRERHHNMPTLTHFPEEGERGGKGGENCFVKNKTSLRPLSKLSLLTVKNFRWQNLSFAVRTPSPPTDWTLQLQLGNLSLSMFSSTLYQSILFQSGP